MNYIANRFGKRKLQRSRFVKDANKLSITPQCITPSLLISFTINSKTTINISLAKSTFTMPGQAIQFRELYEVSNHVAPSLQIHDFSKSMDLPSVSPRKLVCVAPLLNCKKLRSIAAIQFCKSIHGNPGCASYKL